MKKEYLILILVIAGLGSYLFMNSRDGSNYSLPVLGEVAKADVTRVDIGKEKETLYLEKKGDAWVVGDKAYAVDEKKIDAVLSALHEMKLTALVSETGDLNRYDLSPEKRLQVTAKAGDRVVREIEVGKAAPTYRHTFVRIAGDDRVYHAAGNFRSDFDQTVDGFREKRVLSYDTETLTGMRVTKGENDRGFSREKSSGEGDSTPAKAVWKADEGTIPDEKALERLVEILSDLKCSRFSASESKEAFKDSVPVATVTAQTSVPVTLSLYEKNTEGRYPGVSSGSEYPFELDSYQAEDILKKINSLLEIKEEEGDSSKDS